MARLLAREHHANLVLVARRQDRLDVLKAELETSAKVQVRVIQADLSDIAKNVEVFASAVDGITLHGAILNAAVTHFGPWDELSFEGFQQMLSLNVTSIVQMTSLLVPHLLERSPGGGILLVSSMTGLTPVPYQTAYSATKAFLNAYGRGMIHELAGKDVSITVYAPGGIDTEMTEGDRFKTLRGWLMTSEDCARAGLSAFVRRDYVTVPGLVNKLGVVASRLLPMKFTTEQVASQYRKALKASEGGG